RRRGAARVGRAAAGERDVVPVPPAAEPSAAGARPGAHVAAFADRVPRRARPAARTAGARAVQEHPRELRVDRSGRPGGRRARARRVHGAHAVKATIVAAGLGVAACTVFGGADRRTPAALLHATQQALRAGDVLAMESLLARARQRFPVDADVLLYDALLADMRWHDDIGLADLRAAAAAGHPQIPRAELEGRVGDKLFALGSWAESAPLLRAGAAGGDESARARRRAWAELADVLPAVHRDPASVQAQVEFNPAQVPELLLGLGDRGGAFVLDTGATFTTLSESLAARLRVDAKVEAGEVRDGAGRPFAACFARLPALMIGGLRLGPMPVLVVRDQTLSMRDLFGGPGRGVD